MLVLTRKPGEKIVIEGGIVVTVLQIEGCRVRIGIEAPEDVRILRGELACWLESAGVGSDPGPGDGSPLAAR